MKKLLLVSILGLTVLSACAGSESSGSDGEGEVSFEGTWLADNAQRVHPTEDFREVSATMDVRETEGRTFVAEITWSTPEGDMTKQVVGAMSPDGDLIEGADEEGYYSFSAEDENNLDYCYTEANGPDEYLAACGQFTRDE